VPQAHFVALWPSAGFQTVKFIWCGKADRLKCFGLKATKSLFQKVKNVMSRTWTTSHVAHMRHLQVARVGGWMYNSLYLSFSLSSHVYTIHDWVLLTNEHHHLIIVHMIVIHMYIGDMAGRIVHHIQQCQQSYARFSRRTFTYSTVRAYGRGNSATHNTL